MSAHNPINAICLAPHNDDETLFCFYQLLRFQPKVIVILRSYKQWVMQNGPSFEIRERETNCAMEIAGCSWSQWEWTDHDVPWDAVALAVQAELRDRRPDVVIYPAWELGGHEDHNAVASIIGGIEGPWEHVRYVTYRRGMGRSQTPNLVEGSDEEAEKKLKALLCYKSQIGHVQAQDWFPGGSYHTLSEWLA